MLEEFNVTAWMLWLAAALGLIGVEIFSATFYLLMVGLGSIAGSIAAYAGADITIQIVIAAGVTIVSTYALRRSKLREQLEKKTSVNMDVGQIVNVEKWCGDEESGYVARVKYRGAMWDIDLESGHKAKSGAHIIQALRGSRLLVKHVSQ